MAAHFISDRFLIGDLHPFVRNIDRSEESIKERLTEIEEFFTNLAIPTSYSHVGKFYERGLNNRLCQRHDALRFDKWERQRGFWPTTLAQMARDKFQRVPRVSAHKKEMKLFTNKRSLRVGLMMLAMERKFGTKTIFALITLRYSEFLEGVAEKGINKVCRDLKRLPWLNDLLQSKKSIFEKSLDEFDSE
ncbi:MAG: hypothetical protein Q9217_005514 [Psora testacea]